MVALFSAKLISPPLDRFCGDDINEVVFGSACRGKEQRRKPLETSLGKRIGRHKEGRKICPEKLAHSSC
jgi:hypothetical protein